MTVDGAKRWKLCGSVCDFIPRLRRLASITLVVVLGCGANGLANEDQFYITTEKAEGRFRLSSGEPAVKYRGIFINDENPALLGWVNKTFSGFSAFSGV